MSFVSDVSFASFVSLLPLFPLDIQVCIAENCENIWYLLYLCDAKFREYSETWSGRLKFRLLFTKCYTRDTRDICDYGCRKETWRLFGRKHRDNDQPAQTNSNGLKRWYQNDKLHRDCDQPAEITELGIQCWYQHGVLDRENGKPATILPDGTQYFYVNGELVDIR